MPQKNETRRSTWAMDMGISEDAIRTVAEVTFNSVSTVERRREIAKGYKRALQISEEDRVQKEEAATP